MLEMQILKYTQSDENVGDYINSVAYNDILENQKREKLMILTEGAVFSFILVFLVFRVKKSVEQEIEFSKQQQNFILSITHELKSPLSSIKLMSQTLAKHNLKEEQKSKLVNNSLQEVERLQNLVENVLLAAKIDNKSYGFSKSEIDLSGLVEKLTLRCKTASNANLSYEIEKGIKLDADISGMTSIIINLVENAIKYSNENAPVFVSLQREKSSILFMVKDHGIGIIDEEKVKIFNKFYRVGNEETRATKGTGLGLYIVEQLVKFHNGTIVVRDNEPNGSVFEVNFQV